MKKRINTLTIILFLLASSAISRAEFTRYCAKISNTSRAQFTPENTGIPENALTKVKETTALLAMDCQGDSKMASKLVAISLQIDPTHRSAFTTNVLLQFRQDLPPPTNKEKHSRDLGSVAFGIGKIASKPKALELYGMLIELSNE
ncbi:MAG: hypothetical protein AAF226_10215, partial [Verrucomicrobiota bacterium]